ncbi:hypothetical protein [Taklimakanibacter lacteus]|uniref:hypothetical protein n=1 Tax=Taklimakanibacter lacteus TaxID=2268456 RepID=UPI000E6686C2
MRKGVLILPFFLLGGCSTASMPDLEDVPPTAQASADPEAAAGLTGLAELTAEQRTDIEQGVRRGLSDDNSAVFGRMKARVSQFTTQSYIVCGWVNPGSSGYQPFVAMYVPKMRNALLIGVGGRQPPDAIRRRCIDEGVPLDS